MVFYKFTRRDIPQVANVRKKLIYMTLKNR